MKTLLFLILLCAIFSCKKYQDHCWGCDYLRLNTITKDTLVNYKMENWGICDKTKDEIILWMQKEEEKKFEIKCGDTIWIKNYVHCLQATCPEY